jgi:hypothetical protein
MNQLAFPGLGTIMAGRRTGYLQALIMVIGFILATGYMVWFIICITRLALGETANEAEWTAQYHRYGWAGKYGLALCIVAWCWSLVSSIGILRQSRQNK